MQDLSFAGTPGYNYSIIFTTDGIDKSKQSNKQYMTSINTTDITFDMLIDLRECAVGEQFTDAGKCTLCPNGTSYSLVQMTEPGSCTECPSDRALCLGGTNIGPQPGYWRSSNTSSNFIQCLLPEACLGMTAPDYNPTGECAEGYQGILCTDCQPGYSRTGDYECSLCPNRIWNVVRLGLIFLVVVALIVFLIRSTLTGAHDKRNVTSIYTKILMNHIQLILLTASFNFDWPEKVVNFFDVAKPVAEVSTQIISVDCFLQSGITDISSVTNYTSYDSTEDGPVRIVF